MFGSVEKSEAQGGIATVESDAYNGASRRYLWFELFAMFAFGPVLYWHFLRTSGMVFPALWLWALVCLLLLLRDKRFERRRLGWRSVSRRELGVMFLMWGVLGVAMLLGVMIFDWLNTDEHVLFQLVRRRPMLWIAIMIGYPVASVYAQELIFRTFFFQRYRDLLSGRWAMILASAVAFGWVHIIFNNLFAVGMTLIGGIIFAWRYERTGSTLLVSFEHALYGCLVFTLGIGEYFYSGAVQ